MANFLKDLNVGESGQNLIISLLNDFSLDVKTNKNNEYDISCLINNYFYTFEVKYDIMANSTGNIAIEYYNPKSDKPSGITATQADYWICILNPEQIYISTVENLKKFLDKEKPHRIINKGGDSNSSMLLYKAEVITTKCFKQIKNSKDLKEFINEN